MGSYFLLVRWLVFLNLLITAFMAVFVVVPWEVGKSSCPNLTLASVGRPDSILDECRPSNTSLGEDELYESDQCWLEYQLSVFNLVANHSNDAMQLIQVSCNMYVQKSLLNPCGFIGHSSRYRMA